MEQSVEWPTIAAAGFAAVAAVASWASVFQNRRERLAAGTPEVHLEPQRELGTDQIMLHIASNGGLAKRVRFIVVAGSNAVFGYPAPIPTFRAAESRVIETALEAPEDTKLKGFIACYDATGARYYVWPMEGKPRVYRMRGWRRHRGTFSDDTLMKKFYPGFDITTMTLLLFKTIERSL
jgi:hypothetical protein